MCTRSYHMAHGSQKSPDPYAMIISVRNTKAR